MMLFQRIFQRPWLFVYLALLCQPAHADGGSPFQAMTKEYALAATSSSGTAIQIAPLTNGPTGYTQYRIFVNCTAAATVSLFLGPSQASVTTAVQPVANTPQQFSFTYPCGTPIEVLGGPPAAWVNAITSTGTATLYITGGVGL